MKTDRFYKFLIGSIFFMGAVVSASELSAPQQVIEQTSIEIRLVLKRDNDLLASDPGYVYRLVDEVLIPHVDLNKISALVLGRYWKRTDAGQKDAFKSEFKRMLVRTYATAFNELDEWQMSYLPSRYSSNSGNVMVRTMINRNGPSLGVDYSMHNIDGAWKVYDVKIEGMSLVTNYRSSFSRLMKTSGIDGLIAHLSEVNDQKLVAENNQSGFKTVVHTVN